VNGKFCSAKWALAQKQGQRAGLEISIKPDACRAGALPPGPVLMTTYLKTSETNRYSGARRRSAHDCGGP
jgi:hypothetical protein